MAVTYRGSVKELQGTEWTVPDAVLKAGQAAKWIESQHRQAQAEEAAQAEAEQRQRELLAARLEQQRQQAAADQAALAQEQGQAAADGQFRVELSDLSQAVMTAGAAIVGKGELIEAQTREWEGRHEALVANSEQVVADAKEQVAFSNAVTQTDHEQITAELEAAQQRISSLESELRTVVMGLTGPQGDRGERGLAGSGVGYVDADPTRMEQGSLGKRIYGRAVVPGDLLLQRTPDSLKIWRTPDARGWQQVDEILNRQELVSQRLAVQDNSSHTLAVLPAPTASGEGGSADNLKTVVQSQGGWNRLASLDRYAAMGYSGIAKSALISVEATIVDGPHSGRTGSWLISAALDKVGACNVEIYAELGEIPRDFGVAPSIEIRSTGTFQVPAGITGTFPAAASIECFCNGWLEPLSGWAGRPNQMMIRGWIKWNTDSRIVGVTPAWTLQQELN